MVRTNNSDGDKRSYTTVVLFLICGLYLCMFMPPSAPLVVIPTCAGLALILSTFLVVRGPLLSDRIFGVSAALPAAAAFGAMLWDLIRG